MDSRSRSRTRDAGLARLRRSTRAVLFGATALAGAFAGLAAHSAPGHHKSAARTTTRVVRTTARTTTQAPTTDDAPAPTTVAPAPPPVTTEAPPVVTSGGS